MFRFIQLFLLAFLLTAAVNANAQRDTVFWFAAPDVSAGVGDTPVKLRFQTYDQPATITVTQPANGAFVPLTLTMPAFSSDSLDLSTVVAQIESPAGNVVSNNGIKISATAFINSVYEVIAPNNKESFSLKGGKALGTNFYTPFQKFWDNSVTAPATYSGIEIVASMNNTTVLITPRTAITGHLANATFSVVLNAGQTYSARDVNVSAVTSLAGSIVSANNPIAVTLFDGQLAQSSCGDMIGDQLIPTPSIGTDYSIYKGTSTTDRIYVLATQNASSIEFTGASTTTTLINSSETLEIPMTDEILYIKASKPVYVYHVSGFGCELSAAVVPSLNCKGNNNAAFSRSSSDSLGVVLVTRSGFEGNFLLNGNSGFITAGMFQTVPGTSGQYKTARVFFNTTDIPVNSHNMVENLSDIFTMATISGGGTNTGASYAYNTDFYATAFSEAGPDDTVCANVNYTLNGNVGGGAVTGAWSSNGYGSFQNGLNSVPNTYIPSPLDTLISPIRIILSTTGFCPVSRDTMYLEITPAPLVNANTDQSICKNNALVQLNGIIGGGAVTGIWTSNGSGAFLPNATTLNAEYVPSAADLTAGGVQFVLTSTNAVSCAMVSDTMEVNFTDAATVDAGADTLVVCANNANITLSGTVSGPTTTGKWLTSGTGIFSPNNSSLNCTYVPSVADTTAGFVWLYLESTSNGNCNPVQDSIYVSINNAPKVDAGPNQLKCSNAAQVQLNGSIIGGPFGGVWSGGTGTFTPSNSTLNAVYVPSATEIANGSVVLTLTSTNNGTCTAVTDGIQINFAAPPFANFSATNVCEGLANVFTDFSLPGSGTLTNWSWKFLAGQTSSGQNPTYNFGTAGSYPVELIVTNSNGCKDTVSVSVSVFDKPVAGFNSANSCPNNQVTVAFTDASASSETINYWFYDFGGQGSAAMADVNQQFASGGTYTITHIVSTVNGCSDTIIQPITIDPLPDAGFYYNSNGGMNIGAVFNFIDTSEYAVSYSWTFGDGVASTQMNPSHTYYGNGNYYIILEVANALGCIDSAIRFIAINTVTTEINTLIPTIISPNGDSSNDVWKLEFLQLAYPNAHIEIYNEWGQTVFTSDGYETPWDGTYKGEPVPDGNYMYVIQLNANADPDIYKGVLMVLRKRD
ncbi:PKD domain-containing protein [Fluviicola chungangensis]|uniref:PKD domain-containing protein n=1 Tax=Fluviicola chungangensis TaxID=2597671 RepID=A0A556MMM2_9FLAO|nr:PKD domain-containing protein [Fluviicola chungangensis]TSJ41194.1 PKD domain-containing protein [Fluviicola chungangensis]